MSMSYLDIDESVILTEHNLTSADNPLVDLILTNKNLIQINKGYRGAARGVFKYPLSDLSVTNGKADVRIGKDKKGKKILECHFISSDNYYRLKNASDLKKWVSEIEKAHMEAPNAPEVIRQSTGNTLVDSFIGSFDKIIPSKRVQNKTFKCPRCGAELSGVKGERVVCDYCDSAVIIR